MMIYSLGVNKIRRPEIPITILTSTTAIDISDVVQG